MKKKRIIGISLTILTAILAMVTVILQVKPATYFINLIAEDNKFQLKLAFLLTWLALLLPFFLIIFAWSILRRKRNVIPKDLKGHTGILLKRKRTLYSAAFNFYVYVDEVKMGSVGNGQSIFVSLTTGNHVVRIDGFDSSRFDFELKPGQVLKLETQIEKSGMIADVIIVPKETA